MKDKISINTWLILAAAGVVAYQVWKARSQAQTVQAQATNAVDQLSQDLLNKARDAIDSIHVG